MKKRSFEALLAAAAREREKRHGDHALGRLLWAIELAFGSRVYGRVCELAAIEQPIQIREVPNWEGMANALAFVRGMEVDHLRPKSRADALADADVVVKRDDGTHIAIEVKQWRPPRGAGKGARASAAPQTGEPDEVAALLRARDLYERNAASFKSLVEDLAECRTVAR